MLVGDRVKFLGIVSGLTFAAMLITQQGSIFCGLMLRTCGLITDTTGIDLWVMDPNVRFFDDLRPMVENNLYRIRGVDGVEWAVPFFKGAGRARIFVPKASAPSQSRLFREATVLLSAGASKDVPASTNTPISTCDVVIEQVTVLGIDDGSLVGAPPAEKLHVGRLGDLHRSDAILVDRVGLRKLFPGEGSEDADPSTAEGRAKLESFVGRELEMNDRRAVVVGVFEATRNFLSLPIVYALYSRAKLYVPLERKFLSYVLAKAQSGVPPEVVARRIAERTGLAAHTTSTFSWMTMLYYLEHTGIPINFAITTLLGFLVGTAVAGQTFYNFTLESLKQFGALKAMGATNARIVRMVVLQAMVTGALGYGLGVGLAALFGWQLKESELAFYLPWQILPVTATAVVAIAMISSVASLRRVLVLEPAIVFRG
jgi:putative ABC transport system permease protein